MTLDHTAVEGFSDAAPGRPAWLMTLADLALLLVGFFVFVQATQLDKPALAKGIRDGFGAQARGEEPMAVGAAAMLNFAPSSAILPSSPAGLIAWAREAARDPRVTLKISGGADGSPSDVDRATGSGAVLAADRARAVAAALAGARVIAPGRMTITNGAAPRRAVVVTLGFAGNALPPGNQSLPLAEGN
ncbi:flagellar motor protein MotB [Sphingomonas sp. PB4P5]|uniref:flagellar motor protein MotB n=1 Tax=Parasphingomonas puruogangriensis TaxID=3096155 RepID=UPI002FC8C23D